MKSIQLWNVYEASFNAKIAIDDILQAEVDVIFTHKESGAKMTVPAFWDGGFTWRVRFAPTELGVWEFEVKETAGISLGIDGLMGNFNAVEYTGEYEIYKRGFVKTLPGTPYFVYNDGTPFFYLGDTHWNMIEEEYDEAGPHAADIITDSHFKYIVNRRREQGFTVYQSEPIGADYNVFNGKVEEEDVPGFQKMDKYFKYVAENGFVHANALLIFSFAISKEISENIRPLTRYWIARYGAYPVMWSLGQEVDSHTYENKPFLKNAFIAMCECIAEIDPYKNPISAHQMNACAITCAGDVPVSPADGGYNGYNPEDNKPKWKTKQSVFADVKGHTWWASQWRPIVDQQFNFGIPKDYWENGNKKPIVDFEARYHFLYGGDFCMRAQAWLNYLNGMVGHAYGGADMWLYKGKYALDTDGFDGVEVITSEKKKNTYWGHLVNAPISNELIYLKNFFEKLEWWKLEPDFDYGKAFKKVEGKDGYYACAHEGDKAYVVYLYNRTVDSAGKLVNMDKTATYTAQWFDTRRGEYILIDEKLKADNNGEYDIPPKSVASDMVLLVTKN